MEIVKNLNTIKSINKKINFELKIDKKYKYIINGAYEVPLEVERKLAILGYKIQYISGCFNSYLIKI